MIFFDPIFVIKSIWNLKFIGSKKNVMELVLEGQKTEVGRRKKVIIGDVTLQMRSDLMKSN